MIAALVQLALVFGLLSLLAVGGVNAVLPDLQRTVVDVHHWMTDREFLDLFAISRIAPGPGSLIVTLIGQKVAGLAGAAVASIAMFGPCCILVYLAARAWHRAREAAWRKRAERALGPVAIGLMFGSALGLMRETEHSWAGYGVTALASVLLAATEWNPLLVLAAGGALGLAWQMWFAGGM